MNLWQLSRPYVDMVLLANSLHELALRRVIVSTEQAHMS
jgi:hypothetical protein